MAISSPAAAPASNTPRSRVPDPSVVDSWIAEMQRKARLPKTLMGGTEAMQKAGEVYLPKNMHELADDYKYRLATARLRNYFKRTVQNTTGRLFSKPFQVEGGEPIMKEICYDIDCEGTDIQAFAKDLVMAALGTAGISFFIVDRDTGGDTTAAADQKRPTAPYWVKIDLDDLIALRSEMVDGERQVTQLRYFRYVQSQDPRNPFNTVTTQQIRVVYRDRWEVYESATVAKRKTWTVVSSGANTLNRIPLVPVYFQRTGFMKGENPLDDLADMNLEHYQIRSEQRRALQINSFPMLVALNYDGDVSDIIAAPNSITGIKGGEGKADLKFIESNGRHLESGRNEVNDLVDQMRAFGAQFDKPGEVGTVESASGRLIDAQEATTQLQLWALSLKDSIELGLYFIGLLLANDGSIEKVGTVNLSLDFTRVLSDEGLKFILEARKLGDLSRRSLLETYRQNSLIGEDFDYDKNDEELDEEAANLADLVPATGLTQPAPKESTASLPPAVSKNGGGL